MADVADGLHHGEIARVLEHVAHEAAVDLEVVHGQLLQVPEAGHAGAEIVQREAAAELAQLGDHGDGAVHAGDGAGFGDLKAQFVAGDAELQHALPDELGEVAVPQAGAGQIDGAGANVGALRQVRLEQLQGVSHHPAVNQVHQVVALGDRDEFGRRQLLPRDIGQAQQHFEVHAPLVLGVQRVDRLRKQRELVFFQAVAQALHPFHVALVALEGAVMRVVDRDAVAPAILGVFAGAFCHAQQAGRIAALLWVDVHHANADAGVQVVLAPLHVEIVDGLAQALGRLHRGMGRAVGQQHGELVAAHAR
ncbi:hypothetical protein N7340_15135 [Comamonas aquatica]|nr:hypothetical protein [Comamonas aquatica]MDH0373092.1 hypothetical protein [Comamonas aquatica]